MRYSRGRGSRDQSAMYALVDCNTMYASCEQIFRPSLAGKPVVVLSNNDGCIVARNAQAKALGIPDLEPYFKQRALLERHQVNVFSSNYELYGDISRRVMNILGDMAGDIEQYSIDEAFLQILSTTKNYDAFGHQAKDRLLQWVGMPVCVGIAPTKTLAKLANRAAKKIKRFSGVCTLDSPEKWEWILHRVATQDIWGVGSKISARLAGLGIRTGYELAKADPKYLRKHFSVVLERTARELNGEPCLPLEMEPAAKKEIVCSRSFGHKITQCQQLQEAVGQYAVRAAEKLRRQNGQTALVWVWVESSRFAGSFYAKQKMVKLENFTNDSREIASAARSAVAQLFRPGVPFHKAGVGLLELKDSKHEQLHLFTPQQSAKSRRLMDSLDTINKKFGRGTLSLACEGVNAPWAMARQLKSPSYTTRWSDIPRVKC